MKFDLASSDDDDDNNIDEHQYDNSNNDSPTRRAMEKFTQFVRSAPLAEKKSDTTSSNLTARCLLSKEDGSLSSDINDTEDALIKKMLGPTPLQKISSLVGNIRRSGSSEEKLIIDHFITL